VVLAEFVQETIALHGWYRMRVRVRMRVRMRMHNRMGVYTPASKGSSRCCRGTLLVQQEPPENEGGGGELSHDPSLRQSTTK
jgi:hypothetical protein